MRQWKRQSHLIPALCLLVLAGSAWWLLRATRVETLGRFTTDLSERSPDQRRNIRLAAERLDGAEIKPGCVFSFNRTVGELKPSRGYRPAPAIQAGEIRPQWGGGVCQLSSTLYNAALLAGMEITERSPHTYPVRSVPPGRDAMVSAGVSDLAFRNSTPAPVSIRARISGDRLVVSLLGRRPCKQEISVEAHIADRIPPADRVLPDPKLAPGRRVLVNPGQPGCVVEVTRIFLHDGKILHRQTISHDTYRPLDRLFRAR